MDLKIRAEESGFFLPDEPDLVRIASRDYCVRINEYRRSLIALQSLYCFQFPRSFSGDRPIHRNVDARPCKRSGGLFHGLDAAHVDRCAGTFSVVPGHTKAG